MCIRDRLCDEPGAAGRNRCNNLYSGRHHDTGHVRCGAGTAGWYRPCRLSLQPVFRCCRHRLLCPYVEWAASKGIVTGTSETTFAPDATITREQMAVIMQRYANQMGYTLPVAREAELFTDSNKISSGMKEAVQAMQQAGVMNGKGSRLFAPKDTATRTEAAAVLRRFVEIVIDRDTAGGWAQDVYKRQFLHCS